MTEQPPGRTPRTSSIAAEEAPASDLADAPQWPPLGAYPGEPGHPGPAGQAAAGPAGQPAPVAGAETVEGEVVWHQEPPAGPWHAKHEKPGEWRTHPPEHLAFEHSPPAEVQPGVQHDQPTEAIPLSMLPQPWEVPFDPHATETVLTDPPPKRRRTALWVALALVLTLLLFGGGTLSALMLLRNADSGKGSPDPATAVDRFLTAAYTQHDAAAAGDLVCREARDEDKLKQRIDQIKGYANAYQAPVFRWSEPAVSGQSEKKAVVAVQLTMTTDDEKAAQQELTFTVVHKTGWLVCDING
ncbi:hypothetical protein [Actinoplanes sp. NPDC049316]|uniref:Rv0361 family membrane protein n=1 Tax=Actinoplanes sp. NPDC049316 TaxID=3154727 RepID=UPI00342CBA8C